MHTQLCRLQGVFLLVYSPILPSRWQALLWGGIVISGEAHFHQGKVAYSGAQPKDRFIILPR